MNARYTLESHPLLRLAVVFVAGMAVGERLPSACWLAGLAVAMGLSVLLRRRALGQSVSLFAVILLSGGWLMARAVERSRRPLPSGRQHYEAVLTTEPAVHGRVVTCDLQVASGAFTGRRLRASILRDTLSRRYEQLHVGDGIAVRSTFQRSTNFVKSRFSYVQWLTARGFIGRTFIPTQAWEKRAVSLRSLSALDRLRLRALVLRQRLLRHYASLGFTDSGYALVTAMTMGDRSALSRETRELFSQTGASHVLALSGLHLGILYFFLTLSFRHARRQAAVQTVLLTAVWGYVFLTGMSVSVMRAATMLTVYAAVGLMGRTRLSLNTLALTALLMLVANPLLLWDVSFQMSILSVLGIMVYYRPLYFLLGRQWLQGHPAVARLWSLTAVSASAQLGAAPLVMYYFGQFSPWFLLTNYVAVPATTLILLLSFLMILLMPWPALQQPLAYALNRLAWFMESSLQGVASLPMATIDGLRPSAAQTLLSYVLTGVLTLLAAYLCKLHRLQKQYNDPALSHADAPYL